MLTGLFYSREDIEKAYGALRDHGYSNDEINVLMSDVTREKYFSKETIDLGNKSVEGTSVGALAGGSVGAIVAGIVAIGPNLVLPGIGLIIAGPLAAAVAGAGIGGLAGGIAGALIGWGIPDEKIELYEKGIREGGVLLNVRARSASDAEYFENEWTKNYRGEHVYH